MRIVSVACVLILLISGTMAFADPSHNEGKPWSYGPFSPRAIVPEVEPNNACPGQAINCGDQVLPASINPAGDVDFFEFYGNAGDQVTIGTDAYNGSTTDTYLELYGSDCTQPRLTYDDDSGPGYFSLISNFLLPTTGLYHIKVRGYSSTTTGDYQMFLTCVIPPPPPENDTCDGAIVLQRCSSGSLSGDVTLAINNYDPGVPGPSCTGFTAAGKDVVYKVDLQAGDVIDMTYTQLSYDTSFYVVTDCANVTSSCVIGADDTVTGDPEVIHYVVAATGTYYIILDVYGTNTGGAWTMTYDFTCPAPAQGACCVGTVCTIMTQVDCEGQGGIYQGDDTSCTPNPCDEPNPVQNTTWGQIKSNYR